MASPLSKFVTVSATGTATLCNLDSTIAPFNVAIQVYVPGGVTTTYSVEFTLDELMLQDGSANPNVRWTTDPQFPVASSATITGNYLFPIAAVRLNVATIAGGSIELKVRQSISIN
ncbi:hypothetical protein BMW22_15630 [Rhizobium leguminosarum]|uniref:Uncharacterized protein n=1 Tax=Rhizobium leguminosarum TaxID=384 RepID=A0A1L3ZB18_RHILE|nr:hypothetical protein [Rhizobium leguminosarum]API52855.1 hypothetical protein BMW22_15630 [Rhizobium leguminosarum]